MKTFKDAQKLEVDTKVRLDLAGSKEWQLVKDIIEAWSLKLNANLLSGTEIERGLAEQEFRDFRAFVQRWNRFVSLIEQKDVEEEN